MIISREDVIAIFAEIVRLWPYSECNQLDTFAVVDNVSDMESNNLGKTMVDYSNGHFWSRKWVNQGADPNTLSKTYPLLVLEQKGVTKPYAFDKEVCWEWWIVLADVPDCVNCGDCNRSKDTIDTELQIMALDVLSYLQEIKLFTFDSSISIWTSKEQADKYISDGVYTAYEAVCGDILSYVSTTLGLSITPANLGLTDGARSVIFSLTIRSCNRSTPSLGTRSTDNVTGIAQPCKTC